MRPTTEQRFWAKVEKASGCWSWIGAHLPPPHSYGKFRAPNTGGYAHRYSWILHFGAIPDEMFVLHKCDNPICVRPDHLFLGTHADNMADRNQKGRARGGSTGHITPIKLTAEQVRLIRKEYAAGHSSTRQLARSYGVCKTTIVKIINRQIWQHV